jgi:S-formylglutathione hydrolase FrmB
LQTSYVVQPQPGVSITLVAAGKPADGSFPDPDALWVNRTVPSPVLYGRAPGLSLVLPADYNSTTTRYPVIWVLHGLNLGGTNEGFIDGDIPGLYGAAIRGGFPKHIVAMPSGLNWSMWMNNYDGSLCVERYLMQDVMPYVHANFRTLGAGKQYNAFMSFSMGAFGSLHKTLKYRDQFAACVAFGAPLYAPDYAFGSGETANWAPQVLGPVIDTAARARYTEGSPFGWLSPVGAPPLYIRYGDSDPLRNTTGTAFKALLDSSGIAYTAPTDLAGTGHNSGDYYTNGHSAALAWLQPHLAFS